MGFTPADTAIMNEVEARLKNIRTGNGYNNQFRRIERARMTVFKGHDLPAANYYHANVSSEKTPYGHESKTMTLIVEAHSKTRDEPFIDIADSLAADIVTGLFRSTSAPATSDNVDISFGGTIRDIRYLSHDPFIGQGQEPFCGTLVQFEVRYETPLGNMENYE